VLPVHYRLPETLPPHHRDFPPRDRVPDPLHVRDTRFLLLLVFGYLVAMLGGVVVLNVLTPATQATMHPMEAADAKVGDR
jgi:hypothetical protein